VLHFWKILVIYLNDDEKNILYIRNDFMHKMILDFLYFDMLKYATMKTKITSVLQNHFITLLLSWRLILSFIGIMKFKFIYLSEVEKIKTSEKFKS
jgi:hypothetical protein